MYRIGFLLLPDFQLLGVFGALETLRVANSLFSEAPFEARLVHDDTPDVRSSSGMVLRAEGGQLAEQSDCDLLVVSASFVHDRHDRAETRDLLRRFDRHGMRLGAFESGASVLARAGLLRGRQATAHFNNLPMFAQLFPEVEFVRQVYTISPDRMTCGGGTACIDLMLELVAERLGPVTATRTANLLNHPRRRAGTLYQGSALTAPENGLPELVRGAARLMERHMDPPLGAGEIAARLGVSRRQLDRVFRSATGSTVAVNARLVRLARARKLVKGTDLDLASVAERCGFASYPHFVENYRRAFGTQPSTDRLAPASGDYPALLSPLADLHPFQTGLDPVRLV